jgi:hypothetical protein
MKFPRGFWVGIGIGLTLISNPGCSLFSDATISEMVPGMSDMMDKLECWVTIEFKRYPEGINLRDVKVVFSSIALFSDETFDWPYIAAHDQIAQGFGKGYKPNEVSDPAKAPPLKTKIKVNYPLNARPRLENLEQLIRLKAELFWGGESQGSLTKTIEHVYERTSE